MALAVPQTITPTCLPEVVSPAPSAMGLAGNVRSADRFNCWNRQRVLRRRLANLNSQARQRSWLLRHPSGLPQEREAKCRRLVEAIRQRLDAVVDAGSISE